MAHDRQLKAEESSELTPQTKPAKESLDVLADWWALYGQIYRDDPTDLLAQAYREMLQHVKPEILHKAFMRAAKNSPRFRPTPGLILEAAELESEFLLVGNLIRYPEVSQAERDAALEETKEQRWALRQKLGLKADA
jgi:hypothetical protein